MELTLKSGTKIVIRERIGDFNFEMLIITKDKKEVALRLDPDEWKDLALAIHKVASRSI